MNKYKETKSKYEPRGAAGIFFHLLCPDFLYLLLLLFVCLINDSTKNGTPGHTGLHIGFAPVE